MLDVFRSEEIATRDDFALLCNWRHLHRAAEIGVDKGLFSEKFLKHWQGHTYFAVDPWLPYPEMPWGRSADKAMALEKLFPFTHIVKVIQMESREFARLFGEYAIGRFYGYELDFIYIDGSHEEKEVAADIEAWWPKVSQIGILAGHDYDEEHPGVIAAVNTFANKNNLSVRTTGEYNPSWYVYKNNPGQDWKRIP